MVLPPSAAKMIIQWNQSIVETQQLYSWDDTVSYREVYNTKGPSEKLNP